LYGLVEYELLYDGYLYDILFQLDILQPADIPYHESFVDGNVLLDGNDALSFDVPFYDVDELDDAPQNFDVPYRNISLDYSFKKYTSLSSVFYVYR